MGGKCNNRNLTMAGEAVKNGLRLVSGISGLICSLQLAVWAELVQHCMALELHSQLYHFGGEKNQFPGLLIMQI